MARGTELAVGYVSLVAETSDLSTGINRALQGASRDAQQHGNRMGQALGAGATRGFAFRPAQALAPGVAAAGQTGRQMGQSMGQQTMAALKQFLAPSVVAGGLVGVTAAVGLAMGSAVKAGNEMQTNLNRLQGASRATAQEMAQVSARAKELGSDTQLTGVSAQDAAAAMTELVKGGFNVSQAMSAARGTLQLATAAQIDAAQAATIQADALHAFGLQATDAARVADVLANVANASTGEMADFAYGFQAGGAVMNQFGVSVEDAAATLGVLANAGIKSSDAGTLVKSMLLAIASPSDQAATALQELGVSAFDASGNFVGMRALMEQLQDASQRMTPEMYAMNTSIALGSDAARLAGIAAQQGGEGFDTMRVAVERQGAAAELAAANTKGLPGVFERLSNTADRAKLSLYELIEGPLQSAGDAINGGINAALDALEGKTNAGGPIGDLMSLFRDAAPSVVELAKGLGEAASAIGQGAWAGLETVLDAAVSTLQVMMPLLDGVGNLVSNNTTVVAALAAAWLGIKYVTPMLTGINASMATMATTGVNAFRGIATAQGAVVGNTRATTAVMGTLGTNIANLGQHVPIIARMQASFVQGAVGAERFGRAAGLARAGLTGVSGAAAGAIGLLGGPWVAALMAATFAFTAMSSASSDSKRRTTALAEEQGKLTASTKEMYETLARSGGEVDSSVIAKASEQVDILRSKFDTLRTGVNMSEWFDDVVNPENGDPFAAFSASLDKQDMAEKMERISTAMDGLGVTSQSMGVLVSGSAGAWDEFATNARNAGQGGEELLAELQPLRDEFIASKAAAENLTPGVVRLKDQISVLADTTASAEDKTNALKTALDILAGKQPDMQEATKKYNDIMRETSDATKEVLDQTKGYGDELINANGTVNTASENGSKLFESLNKIKDATAGVAATGGDLQAAFAGNSAQFRELAEQTGLTEGQVRRMAEAIGLVPDRIRTLAQVDGKDEAMKDIALIKTELSSLPPNTPVKVDALTTEAETALESVGFKVERLPDNKGIIVTAPTEGAQASLQALIDKMMNVPSQLTITSALSQLGEFNRGSFATAGDAQNARRGNEYTPGSGWIQYDPQLNPDGTRRQFAPRAEGGPIAGPGPVGKDSVPIMAAPGEHMLTVDDVNAMGGQSGVYAFRQALQAGGLVPALAGGGPVKQGAVIVPEEKQNKKGKEAGGIPDVSPGNFPGTIAYPDWNVPGQGFGPPPDSWWDKPINPEDILFPEFMPPGQKGPWLDKWGDKKKKIKFYRNGGAIQALEQGGPVIPQVDPRMAAIDAAYRQSGRPYDYGPWDCSMYMSSIYSAMSGAGGGRQFTTESDFEALGFKPGFKPGALNIGVRRGGGGKNSHMAGTLPNGVNVENSSNGSVYGPGAAGANDFPLQYYYEGPGDPSGLMVTNPTGQPQIPGQPGSPNGNQQGTGSPALMQGQADIVAGLTGGQGAADMAAAGAAPNDPMRTEGLIPAGAGNTAPAGGGFIGGLSGMVVQGVNGAIDMAASAASSGANMFAPGSGAAIQMGAEVAKRGVQYAGEMAGIWGDAAMEIFMPFGTPRWLSTSPASFMPQAPNQSAATTTLEEGAQAAQAQVAAQAPAMPTGGNHMPTGAPEGVAPAPGPAVPPPGVTPPAPAPGGAPSTPGGVPPMAPAGPGTVPTPGTPPPAMGAMGPDWLKGLTGGFGIFDEGGVLQPGMVGANLGTTPEMVLTQDQWADVTTTGAARAPLDPSQEALDFSTHIGTVTVTDVNQMKQELDSRGRLAMMRYAGRHK